MHTKFNQDYVCFLTHFGGSYAGSAIAISDDGAGNPIAIDSKGEVRIFDFDTTMKNQIADSFEKLIEGNIPDW